MGIRIAVINNTDVQCGNAQYGRDFVHFIQHFKGVDGVDTFAHCRDMLPAFEKHRYGVAVVNWHPSRVEINVPLVHAMHGVGIKVMLLFQNSFDWEHRVGSDDLLAQCDAVVAHEPMQIFYDGVAAKNFHYVPHGILPNNYRATEAGLQGSVYIGAGGWPFPWKRPDVLVKAAKHCGLHAWVFCPPYPGFTWPVAQWVAAAGGDVVVNPITAWLEEVQVVEVLAKAKFNIAWYQSQSVEDQFGQTGSARFSIAARRPMIISRHRKFRTLLAEYPDEFYVADTEEEVYALAKQLSEDITAGKQVRVPMKCVIQQNWWRAAERYWGIIQEICS